MSLQLKSEPVAEHSKIVYVIRHGHGQHQLKGQHIKLDLGPALTQHGIWQARALQPKLKFLMSDSSSALVVSSNLLRAVETALFAFPESPIVVQPLARERIANEMDYPAELPALQRLAQNSKAELDLHHYEDALLKAGSHSAYIASIRADDCIVENGEWPKWNYEGWAARAKELTNWLEIQSPERIFLVSHGEFLRRLTGDTYLENCEVRKYAISNGEWKKIGVVRHEWDQGSSETGPSLRESLPNLSGEPLHKRSKRKPLQKKRKKTMTGAIASRMQTTQRLRRKVENRERKRSGITDSTCQRELCVNITTPEKQPSCKTKKRSSSKPEQQASTNPAHA